MSPLLKNVIALSAAFALGEFILTWMRSSGYTLAETFRMAAPRMAFAVTAGAAIGLGLHAAGIQVVP